MSKAGKYLPGILSLCIFPRCSERGSAEKASGHYKNSPPLKDGGKSIYSLATAYHVDQIEFEDWNENDLTDSRLTICLDNSDMVPRIKDGRTAVKAFKEIASAVRQLLPKSRDYKSIYVIFVAKERVANSRVQTAGMDVPCYLL